ncbi:zinc-binding metallopeptidase [Sphingobacterium psychroaquaticum]|uniref:Substrate import-associated zinc metallohydrolase lipoprotein n=1 Tax=Sphingobacterium psychroaquaticum TaxID=561061 RepID=A0A1X7J9X8_9SPHI|nr:putative zinc-binding metallopeptidase [Sphingobacterium psychroaquaticum]SMG24571.1 substrate import-associated zinc metallohydrolase lipoprotein [Sphingobacterium psychroaquaticum]
MKRYPFKYAIALLALLHFSCSKEKLSSDSIFVDSKIDKNELDLYIENKYVKPYNVSIVYKYVDGESDMNYNLSPANYQSAVRMTKLFTYLGIEPYDKITGSTGFIRSYFPKLLTYIGSPAYRNNGTMVLGTAEGGRKITMYNLNALNDQTASDIEFLNFYYFHTIHHEFAHILNQTKDFPRTFNAISGATYVADAWNTEFNDNTAPAAGFISAYAAKEASEDFVEVYSYYITLTPAQWQARLNRGGTAGRAILEAKLNIVKTYFMSVWKIDMDVLRDDILERQAKLPTLDQTSLN